MIAMHGFDPACAPAVVLHQFGEHLRQLVLTNQTLFGGNWEDFSEDLRRRQAGRPYLFKLPFDQDEALQLIHSCQAYETARGEALDSALEGEDNS